MADMATEVGGKPVNHCAANTLPFEEAVSHQRCAAMARLSLERESERARLGRIVGEGRGREEGRELLPVVVGDSYCIAAWKIIELDA